MATLTGQLICSGGGPFSRPQVDAAWVNLNSVQSYLAFIETPQYNVLPNGIIGAQNAVVADLLSEWDGNPLNPPSVLPVSWLSSKFTSPYGDWYFPRPASRVGMAQGLLFRLIVWGTALEAAAQWHVIVPAP